MAVMRVNPNRMELMRLKNQLKTARRGHKLLKDKRDELMRQFLILVKENAALRRRVEELLRNAGGELMLAAVSMPQPVIETALFSGRSGLSCQMRVDNVMSVRVPEFIFEDTKITANQLPYSLSGTTGELDQAIGALQQALPAMIELANIEKKTQLMADEIESTRRRVNSLEHRLIPDLEDTIRSITMKMDENERGNLTRLMKVKDLILERELQARRRQLDRSNSES